MSCEDHVKSIKKVCQAYGSAPVQSNDKLRKKISEQLLQSIDMARQTVNNVDSLNISSKSKQIIKNSLNPLMIEMEMASKDIEDENADLTKYQKQTGYQARVANIISSIIQNSNDILDLLYYGTEINSPYDKNEFMPYIQALSKYADFYDDTVPPKELSKSLNDFLKDTEGRMGWSFSQPFERAWMNTLLKNNDEDGLLKEFSKYIGTRNKRVANREGAFSADMWIMDFNEHMRELFKLGDFKDAAYSMGFSRKPKQGLRLVNTNQSSAVAKLVYDSESRKLLCTYSTGKTHEYRDVPYDKWLSLRKTDSIGTMMNKDIKQYESSKRESSFVPLNSSWVVGTNFDGSNGKIITKDGNVYEFDASPKEYRNFITSDSAGEYFNKNIKPKGARKIDLANEWTGLDSSFLQGFKYDKKNKQLYLKMNNETYRYDKITPKTMTSLMTSMSPGKYFQENIKDKPTMKI